MRVSQGQALQVRLSLDLVNVLGRRDLGQVLDHLKFGRDEFVRMKYGLQCDLDEVTADSSSAGTFDVQASGVSLELELSSHSFGDEGG